MKPRMNTEEHRYYTVEDVRKGLIQEMLEGEIRNDFEQII